MRPWLCLLVALPLAAPARTQEPDIRATSSEVLLDFVVRDKNSHILHNLRPDEVRVLEDGVPQQLRHFEFYQGNAAGVDAAAATTLLSRAAAATPGSEPVKPATVNELRDISLVSVIIADLDPRGRQLAVNTMRDFIKTELGPNTYIGVFGLSFGAMHVVQPYTNSAEKISSAMDHMAHAAMLGQLTSDNQLSLPSTSYGSALNGEAGTASDPNGPNGPIDPNGPGGPTGVNTTSLGSAMTILLQLMDTRWITQMHDVYTDSTGYLAPLRDFVQEQGKIPGRKVVLLFSAGLPVHYDNSELYKTVISAANRSNVSIYAVDTRGVTTQSFLDDSRRVMQATVAASQQMQLARLNGQDGLVTPTETLAMEMGEDTIFANTNGNLAGLAEGTGGQVMTDSLNLIDPLKRAMEDVRTHYELTYSPSNTTVDGRFRKIEVKVTRPGARVFARSGYYAVPMLDGHEIYPFEMATLKALNTTPSLHQFDFHATALQFRPGPVRTQMAFVFQTPIKDLTITEQKEWDKVHVCVTALIRDGRGQVVDKISKDIEYNTPAVRRDELEQGEVTFTSPVMLPPGHYTLETAAVDRQNMKASVMHSTLDVPDDSGFTMSDVAVARRVDGNQAADSESADPLQARGGTVTPELWNTLQVQPGGKVRLYAVAYPPAPADAPIDANIEVWRDGQLMMSSPASEVPLDESGAASILASLSTEKLPTGHYRARVSFEYKGERVTRAVEFTLAAGS